MKLNDWNISDDLKAKFVTKDELTVELSRQTADSYLLERLQQEEIRNLDQEIRLEYLEGRQQPGSNILMDLFMNDNNSETAENTTSKRAKLMKDIEWNNSWKPRTNGTVGWTQGLVKNQDRPYLSEVIDKYDLTGIGQALKECIDYDVTNNCYWLLSQATASGSIGEITKISTNIKDGKLEVIGRWYLPLVAGTTYWAGIASDGSYLYITLSVSTTSKLYKFAINADDTTIGKSSTGYNRRSGETLDLTNSIEWVNNATVGTGYSNDVINYSSTEIAILQWYNNTTVSLYFFLKSNGTTGTTTTITGFHPYVGGTDFGKRSMTKNGNDLYIKFDDTSDNKRFIYKFNLTTDIVSNAVVKSSGRWETTLTIDNTADEESWCGITFSHTGDLFEVVGIASGGHFISRRAWKNALWAENTIAEEKYISVGVPATPLACMVESGRYYWTGDQAVTAGAVDIYRHDTQTNNFKSARITGSHTAVYDMCTDGTTLWLLMFYTSNYTIWYGPLSTFIAAMNDNNETGASIALGGVGSGTTWGVSVSGGGYVAANIKYALCYDTDRQMIYVTNSTNTKIDTLTPGGTYTASVYALPSATDRWNGIAYKNNNLYLRDYTAAATPSKVHVFPIDRMSSAAYFRSHILQDPAKTFVTNGSFCIDFCGNDLVSIDYTGKCYYKMKTLEDPDVMQLQYFLDSKNVLLQDTVYTCSPIVNRYFEPEDYTEDLKISNIDTTQLLYHGGYTTGSLDMSSGYNYSGTYRTLGVNGVTVTLSGDCTSPLALVDHINARITAAGGNALYATAFLYNEKYVGIRSKTTSYSSGNLTLAAGSPDALATLGISAGTYNYANAYTIQTVASRRNVPDRKYMIVGYTTEGASLLHMSSFFSRRSSTGKPRYLPEDIRVQHIKRGANFLLSSASWVTRACFIEADLLWIMTNIATPSVMIDLKNGKSYGIYSTTLANSLFQGTFTERNLAKTYSGTTDPQMYTGYYTFAKVFARTFSKEDPSDYKFENKRTYAHLGNETAGDLMIIEWDKDNNRRPSRVYINPFNLGNPHRGIWISQSGKYMVGNYATDGAFYIVANGTNPGISDQTIPYVWDIAAPSLGYQYLGTAAAFVSGLIVDVSPGSEAYKLPSGQWRNRLYVGTYSGNSSYWGGSTIVDPENIKSERSTGALAGYEWGSCEAFEDRLYGARTNISGSGYHGGIYISTKRRYNTKWYSWRGAGNYVQQTYNNWDITDNVIFTSRPRYMPAAKWGNAEGVSYNQFPRYNNELATLVIPNVYGLQGLTFQRIDRCYHVSKEIELSPDVTEMYYREDLAEGV